MESKNNNYNKLVDKYSNIITNKYLNLLESNNENQLQYYIDEMEWNIIKEVSTEYNTSISSDYLSYELKNIMPKMDIFFPSKTKIIPTFKYAVAAVIGALSGLIFFNPIFKNITETDFILISNILGIFLFTYLYGIFGSKFFKVNYNLPSKTDVEYSVKSYISIWILFLYQKSDELVIINQNKNSNADTLKKLPVQLINKIYKLYSTPENQLKITAQEIIQAAKQAGFQGFDNDLFNETNINGELLWETSLSEKYETFDNIKEGDRIRIEEMPVIAKEKVLKKGLVRKI